MKDRGISIQDSQDIHKPLFKKPLIEYGEDEMPEQDFAAEAERLKRYRDKYIGNTPAQQELDFFDPSSLLVKRIAPLTSFAAEHRDNLVLFYGALGLGWILETIFYPILKDMGKPPRE